MAATNVALVQWVFLLILFAVTCGDIVSIRNEGDLNKLVEYFGCGRPFSKMSSNTIMEFEGGKKHTLFEQPMFCQLSNLSNVTIRSNNGKQAELWCPGSPYSQRVNQTGFGFYNMSNLRLENIKIDNCGGIVPRQLLQEDGQSTNAFGTNQQAVITISMSSDVQLMNMEITHYFGYAVLGLTVLGEFRINELLVKDSYAFNRLPHDNTLQNDDFILSGSGLLLRYADANIGRGYLNATVVISNIVIAKNRNLLPLSTLFNLERARLRNRQTGNLEVAYGGSGMIYVGFLNTQYYVDFTLLKANIIHNFGTIGGAITLSHIDSTLLSRITIADCYISNNTNGHISGSGIQMFYVFTSRLVLRYRPNKNLESKTHDILVSNTVIQNNYSPLFGGGVSVVAESQNIADIVFRFTNTTFQGNVGQFADCLYFHKDYSAFIQSKEVSVYLDAVKLLDNGFYRQGNDPRSSCVYASGLTRLVISGSENNEAFFSGHYTSAIRAIDSQVYLNGTVTFVDNQGMKGGALYLSDNSHLIFIHQSDIAFYNNSAESYGGAICIESANGLQCEIQFLPPFFDNFEMSQIITDVDQVSDLDYSIVFSNNRAHSGNSIFGTQIYDCQPYQEAIVQVSQTVTDRVYQSLFSFVGSNFTSEVRSQPYRVCHCNADMSVECPDDKSSTSYYESKTFPGLDFEVSVVVVDIIGQPINANLYSKPLNDGYIDWADNFQRTLQHEDACSPVSYLFRPGSENSSVEFTLRTDSYGDNTFLTFNVLVQKCPLGFTFRNDECTCSMIYRNNRFRRCNVSTGRIQRMNNEWIGTVLSGEKSVPAYFRDCPVSYCNPNVTRVDLSIEYHMCAEHRQGIVCGMCTENFSNVFGVVGCYECSSVWLLSVFLYMLIGILLVMLIDKLDLTVTNGTINGLIFYTQMTAITTNIFSMETGTDYSARLVRFINLEIGIPVPICFYNGMSTLSEYVLQFFFPLYLGFIVIFSICLTKCYSLEKKFNLAHSVNIFVTLIYLSYGKILTTIVFLLTPMAISVEESENDITRRLVWYYDGTQGYFEGAHAVTGIIAIIIFLVFIVPYKCLILFSQWCLKFRFLAYYLPIVDANVAPFKDKYRFWFGMRLIIIGVLIVESAFLSTYYPFLVFLINTVVLVCLLMFQAYVQPYKSTALNILDLSFLLNLTILYVVQLYVQYGTDSEQKFLGNNLFQLYLGYERCSSALTLLTFFGIIIYHICIVVRKSKWYMKLKNRRESSPDIDLDDMEMDEGLQLRHLNRTVIETRSNTSEYNRYRDSALEL